MPFQHEGADGLAVLCSMCGYLCVHAYIWISPKAKVASVSINMIDAQTGNLVNGQCPAGLPERGHW